MDQKLRTAIHEAAHAVIGRALTLLCGGATIVPNEEEGEWGYSIAADADTCVYAWEKRGKVRSCKNAVWDARIIACMAGMEAELIFFGLAEEGDNFDREQIERMAGELDCGAQQWAAREHRLRSMTGQLIRRHRHRIEKVAEALLLHGTLSAEQIDRLADRSVNDVKVNAPFLIWAEAQNEGQDF